MDYVALFCRGIQLRSLYKKAREEPPNPYLVYEWGANTYGQLGQGVKTEQCIIPTNSRTENIDLHSVKSIVGGGGHTLLLTNDDRIFACGSNTKGQLGLEVNSEHPIFEELPTNALHLNQLSCGWDSSLGMTKDGELFVWGSNTYGQLGIPKSKINFTSTPTKVSVPALNSIASGLRHSAMVTKTGHVLVCGNGRKGQLGLVDGNGVPIPELEQLQEVPGLTDVSSVACGQNHTIVLTYTGRVFAWGDNKHGQLGVDPTLHPSLFTPMEIQTFPHKLDSGCSLFSGWTHVAILTDHGTVINWGRNTYGQLGCHEYQRPVSWKPQIMNNLGCVKQMAVGSEHNIALLETGEIVSWGWNEHGNCGTGTEEDVRTPTPLADITRKHTLLLGCGAGHSFAVVNN